MKRYFGLLKNCPGENIEARSASMAVPTAYASTVGFAAHRSRATEGTGRALRPPYSFEVFNTGCVVGESSKHLTQVHSCKHPALALSIMQGEIWFVKPLTTCIVPNALTGLRHSSRLTATDIDHRQC